MNISKEVKQDVMVFRLDGKLLGGPDSEVMREAMKEAVEDGYHRVLVDLGKVSLINSTGVGILIASHTTLKRHDGTLKLLHVAKRIANVLMISGLMTIFEAYNDEDEALASFGS